MKKAISIIWIVTIITLVTTSVAFAGGNARRPAILMAADRVVALQRTDTGWEGTWYWYVGSTYNATNLTGVTALGLLEAYRDTKDPVYLEAAFDAADFIMTHLGAGAPSSTRYHVRTTAPDIIFLHQLSAVTGDATYATRAILEWDNIKITYPNAAALDSLFRSINRRSAWDMAFFMEAAFLSGDTTWSDGAAAILANTNDTFYYGTDTWWYALNVSASIRALLYCGYGETHNGAILTLLGELISLVDEANGIGGYIQDTAYAVIAFRAVGGAAQKYANDMGRWLATQQSENGGWLEAGDEYPEINGEALRALASTIGNNVTMDGFDYGTSGVLNSSWRREIGAQEAVPFNEE